MSTHNRCFAEAVLTSTHNLCFGAKIKKIGIPLGPVLLYKYGVHGGIYCTDMFSEDVFEDLGVGGRMFFFLLIFGHSC